MAQQADAKEELDFAEIEMLLALQLGTIELDEYPSRPSRKNQGMVTFTFRAIRTDSIGFSFSFQEDRAICPFGSRSLAHRIT